MTVIVVNNSNRQIKVSLPKIDPNDNSHFFQIDSAGRESWDRGDVVAFVVGAPFTTKKMPKVYFIAGNETLIIEDGDLD